jgi:hypothetical protein
MHLHQCWNVVHETGYFDSVILCCTKDCALWMLKYGCTKVQLSGVNALYASLMLLWLGMRIWRTGWQLRKLCRLSLCYRLLNLFITLCNLDAGTPPRQACNQEEASRNLHPRLALLFGLARSVGYFKSLAPFEFCKGQWWDEGILAPSQPHVA